MSTTILAILAIIAAPLGSVITIIIQGLLNKKKDVVDIQHKILNDLYVEIGRLQESVSRLRENEEQFIEREQQLLSRIAYLENENKEQASEINMLKKELNFYVKRNLN
jgi:chromosome segregation ATPase